MTEQELWEAFCKSRNITETEYEAWAFGEAPDELLELVLQGVKTATSSAFDLYELEGESVPQAGEYSVLLDSCGNAVCVIQTTKVYVERFDKVSEEHAYKEGEGDRSLDYWREVHENFFTNCLKEVGLAFDGNRKVVCEEFEVVYSLSSLR